MRADPVIPLWRRVVLINGLIFAVGTAVLAFSPATVSARPVGSEGVVLSIGLLGMLVANGLMVRSLVRPLDRLAGHLRESREQSFPSKVPVAAGSVAGPVAEAVNELLDRVQSGNRMAAAAALAAQESERSRVAQELHDGVGQSLTALLLELGLMVEQSRTDAVGPTTADLERLRENTRAGLDEVRGVARQLRPHVLEDLGLRSALAALTTDLFRATPTHVVRGVSPSLPPLDEHLELVVFRVAQEALTNVARHAGAGTVELRLGPVGSRVVLEVLDDGQGIPADADGTGLRGMHERARLAEGTLEVRRRDGGGTQVRLSIPGTPS